MSYSTSAQTSHGYRLPPAFREDVDNFIARTYTYFTISLLVMAVFGVWSFNFAPSNWLKPLAIADGIMWIACGWFGWRRPLVLVLPLFTVITGLLLGLLAHFFTEVFTTATIITLIAFGGLSAFVWISKWDFSFLLGFLCLAFYTLLAGWIVSFSFQHPLFLIGWTGFGVFTFGCWILYDTSQIIHRADLDLTAGVAAFELILDIVGFHRWLLEHLNFMNIFDWNWKFWDRD